MACPFCNNMGLVMAEATSKLHLASFVELTWGQELQYMNPEAKQYLKMYCECPIGRKMFHERNNSKLGDIFEFSSKMPDMFGINIQLDKEYEIKIVNPFGLAQSTPKIITTV